MLFFQVLGLRQTIEHLSFHLRVNVYWDVSTSRCGRSNTVQLLGPFLGTKAKEVVEPAWLSAGLAPVLNCPRILQ